MDIETRNRMKGFNRMYEKQMEKMLVQLGLQWLENVIPHVPVDTGKLRQSMYYEIDVPKRSIKVGSTLTDPPYAIWVETGTSRQAAQPYLEPSLMNYLSDYLDVIREHLGPSWSVSAI